jgi:hypothetical protein
MKKSRSPYSNRKNCWRFHKALERLEKLDNQQGQIVEMHYFAGNSMDEIAIAFDISERGVKRELQMARLFLKQQLEGPGDVVAIKRQLISFDIRQLFPASPKLIQLHQPFSGAVQVIPLNSQQGMKRFVTAEEGRMSKAFWRPPAQSSGRQ